ncbi:MAG: FecR family protein, partial [Thermoanaerobaculia bacterium]
MNVKRIGLLAASIAFLAAGGALADNGRSAYTYIRESTGQVTVDSSLNGEVEARRNMPISAGDQVRTAEPARAEIALADGNVLHVGGGTRIRFESLTGQQGSDDQVSEVTLSEGSVILSVVGSSEGSVPRIDTDDAAVYANSGARVRVNADPRRGTSVVVRAGSVEVRTRSGSYTVRAGNYLIAQGDQEPEIARGSFSRDRFDLWAQDRLEVTYDSPQSTSGRYVGDDYASDVQSLDGYGDWDYNSSYSSYVWRPRVSAGWSPYSYGSWYYTPVGLTWWSWDPWGWYPFHYGNWFFDAGWNSWCWSPGYVYSPAWVYWGYSGSFFGWCPVGWYGGFSPWWNNYYRNWGFPRGSMAFAINGRFNTRRVDMRGWNFTGAQNVGGRGRIDVIPGTRVVDRLSNDFSVSSRPIVLANRGGGSVRDALRDHIREAPRTIERTSGRDAERLAPVLARDQTLPRATVDALRERAVVAER